MLHMFGRLIAFVVFVACGLWAFTVFFTPSLVAQTGGFAATFWRPLVWAVVLTVLVGPFVYWRRQWRDPLQIVSVITIVGLVVHIVDPTIFARVSTVLIPGAWWIFWFTLAEAVLVLLSLAFLFDLGPSRLRGHGKSQSGGDPATAAV